MSLKNAVAVTGYRIFSDKGFFNKKDCIPATIVI